VTNTDKILIHILAVRRVSANRIQARATLRLGDPKPGETLWFEGIDRARRRLDLISVKRTKRLSTILLEGMQPDLDHLVGGMYVYGGSIDS